MSGEHPGLLLKTNFLEPLGISCSELSRDLGVARSTITRLVRGHSSLSPLMAAKLAAYFETPPHWWVRMQYEYDLAQVEHLDPQIRQTAQLGDVLPGPSGPMDVGPIEYREPERVRLTREELEQPAGPLPARNLEVRRHDDGSVTLTGQT